MSIQKSKVPPNTRLSTRSESEWLFYGMDVLRNGVVDLTDKADEPPVQVTEEDIAFQAFSCPHCGGNRTETIKGKVYCAYCGTELVR